MKGSLRVSLHHRCSLHKTDGTKSTSNASCRNFSTNLLTEPTLISISCQILKTADPFQKAQMSQNTMNLWKSRKLKLSNSYDYNVTGNNDTYPKDFPRHQDEIAPDHPSRPDKPVCVSGRKMPPYKQLGVSLPVYLMHGMAHIELNAIDMVWDMLARFHHPSWPVEFYDDWVEVASDEARHFELLCERLEHYNSYYGHIVAHDSLWKNAERTTHDIRGRIAVMQLVEEARALDSQQRLIQKVGCDGDKVAMKLVEKICTEEIDHVRKGVKWFKYLCQQQDVDPVKSFHELAAKYTDAKYPPPFNQQARAQAGMTEEYYMPLAVPRV